MDLRKEKKIWSGSSMRDCEHEVLGRFHPQVLRLVTNNLASDASDPKTLTEQILAIYPILPGQKSGAAQLPPRQHTDEAPPLQPRNNDLIDFGQDSTPADLPRPSMPPSGGDPKVESTGEISGLLKATGTPAEGPLIDFHDDLKNKLPTIKREDTSGSNDVFVDAKD